MKKYHLEIILFLNGAVVMILELVGSRIVAPYLGTSIFVWTSLIGIILGSLSVGYWCGGHLADKRPEYRTFSKLLLAAALLIGIIGPIKLPVLTGIQRLVSDIRLGAVVAAVLLFAPAGTLLGTISPYAVRLKMQDIGSSGTTVGRLYAISTIGSIVGTFAAGFFLIAYFGSSKILIVLSVIMLLASLLAGVGKTTVRQKAARVLLLFLFIVPYGFPLFDDKPGHLDMDTCYNRIIIEERFDEETGQRIRYLRVDQRWAQSAVVVDHADDLYFTYNKFYRLAEHFLPRQTAALLIGGGAYTFPRDYLRRNEQGRMDVIEIDPRFTQLAKTYFYLNDDNRLTSIHEDGRTFLNRSNRKYDVVYIDVFKASASPPFQLMTREALGAAASALKEDGAVLTNIYSAIQGDGGRFFRAAYATFKSVFPQVYVFPVQYPHNGRKIQNLIIVALKSEKVPEFHSPNPEFNRYLSHRWQKPIPEEMPLLTDEYAPVEHYLVAVIKAFSAETLD